MQVFVYGTLRTGASNDFRMKGATSLGAATICAKLYRVHQDFPGIVLSEDASDILHGEVFTDVSAQHMDALDRYEGCDAGLPKSERIYQRAITTAITETGALVEVYVWEYIREVDEANRISSGDWLR